MVCDLGVWTLLTRQKTVPALRTVLCIIETILAFLGSCISVVNFSLLTRESIGKEAELEMKLAIVSNALMKVCWSFHFTFLRENLSDTVSDGATKTLVLNIEREQYG